MRKHLAEVLCAIAIGMCVSLLEVGVAVSDQMIHFLSSVAGVVLTRSSVPTTPMQKGWTPLIMTAYSGRLVIAELLLKHGARVQDQDEVMPGKG